MPLPKRLERVINKFAKRDRKIGKKFYPYIEEKGDMALYILAQVGVGGSSYHTLGIIDDWGEEKNKYRSQMQFSVYTTREDFGGNANESFFQIIKRASHVAKANGEIYSLNDSDVTLPSGFDFAYTFFGTQEAQKAFNVSQTTNEPI